MARVSLVGLPAIPATRVLLTLQPFMPSDLPAGLEALREFALARADGSTLDAEVEIYLDDIDPGDVLVELFAEPGTDRPGVHAVMFERRVVAGTAHGRVFGVRIPADRPAACFTPRMLPGRQRETVPGEVALGLWHH